MVSDSVIWISLILSIIAISITVIEFWITNFRKFVKLDYLGDWDYRDFTMGNTQLFGFEFRLINLGNLPTVVNLYEVKITLKGKSDSYGLDYLLFVNDAEYSKTKLVASNTLLPLVMFLDIYDKLDSVISKYIPRSVIDEGREKRINTAKHIAENFRDIQAIVRLDYSENGQLKVLELPLDKVDKAVLRDVIEISLEEN